MLNAIGDSLNHVASFNDGEDKEEEDHDEEDSEPTKLSDDAEVGCVMGTINDKVQHHLERFRRKQMRLDEVTQPGSGDEVDYTCDCDMKYGTAELRAPGVVEPQMHYVVAVPALTTLGEVIESQDAVPRKTQMPQVASRPGSSHMRPVSRKPQSQECILSLWPDTAPNSLPIKKSNLVNPIRITPAYSLPS